MIESHKTEKELERLIDLYINDRLSDEEIESLWVKLIQDDHHLDFLKSSANLKAVIEKRRKKVRIHRVRKYAAYAAAAVIALLVTVMTVVEIPSFNAGSSVEPISSIELEYYRSSSEATDGSRKVIDEAIRLANSGDVDQAVSLLEEELGDAEDAGWIAELSLNIGSMRYNSERYEEAIDNFERVVAQDDIDVLLQEKAYWYLGNSYFQLDDLEEARSAIEKAYEINGAYRRVAESYLDALTDNQAR